MKPLKLESLIPDDWRPALAPALAHASWAALQQFLKEEEKEARIFPPRELIFAALRLTPLQETKVVIIGQDPYPTLGNANGLAFSVQPGQKLPASLKNLLLGVQADVGGPLPSSGDLSAWARQGVLLLNTVLTVREGAPNSHQKKGWESITEAALRAVDALASPVAFFCLGLHAQRLAEKVVSAPHHRIWQAPHPSPLNGKAFVKAATENRFFSQINNFMTNNGRETLHWRLDGAPTDAIAS